MASLTKQIKVVNNTKNGEITVNLNLNISISKDGNINVATHNVEESIDWEIPDISVGKIVGDV